MTTLDWQKIEAAGSDHYYIADTMDRAGRGAEEIIEALERFDQVRDMEDPAVREALGIDPDSDARWMDIQSADIDAAMAEAEIRDTEWRGHIANAAD